MSELTTGGINFGYESPVNIIMGQVEQEFKQIQNETENTIMSEIRQQLGVYVDKEELIKALQYDRNQYDKGYSDGKKTEHWIPVSERLPEDLEPVNITWVNHNPVSYYAHIKDKPFTATGHYCKGRWYWYSSTCQDDLEEYGESDADDMSDDIEVIAWMPLPEPYKEEGSDKE